MTKTSDLSVGEMASRAGVPVSTLHYYEAEGLIESWRTPANHRRYDRRELRRIAIARIAQAVGVPLSEVRAVLDRIPRGKAVSAADWEAAAGIAHSIKGAAGNMNFLEIHELALAIEDRIKGGKGNTTAELAEQLQTQIELINSEL